MPPSPEPSMGGGLLERLKALPAAELKHQGWSSLTIAGRTKLWEQGARADSMCVVVSGRLEVLVDGQVVERITTGACLGEASAFFPGDARAGDVVACVDSKVALLNRSSLRKLRSREPAIYDVLLEHCLRALWVRLDHQDQRIVESAKGRARTQPKKPPLLAQLWKRMTTSPAPPPDVRRALKQVPILAQAEREHVGPLIDALEARLVLDEHALFVEGDKGDEIFIVARGSLVVSRRALEHTERDLAVLGPGSVFGAGGFVAGQPRSGSLVARGETWVFGMSRKEADLLPPESRRLLLETVLATTHAQLLDANQLAMAETGHTPSV